MLDNVNASGAERASLVAAGRRHGATVVGYVFGTTVEDCLERNRARSGPARVPAVAIRAAAKRYQPPTLAEDFARLVTVTAAEGVFRLAEATDPAPPTVFLLSPASTSGERARLLLAERADFPLARASSAAAT